MEFETTKEFYNIWFEFEKKCKRQKFRMPKCPIYQQIGINYVNTRRFQWIVETQRMWRKYKRDYLEKKSLE